MRDMRPDRPYPDVLAVRLSRRQVLRRAAVLGLAMPAVSALLAACRREEATPTQAPAAQPTATPTEAAAETPTAAETPAGTPTVVTTPEMTYSMDNPPEVFNADQASQYSGTTLTYYGDSVGIGAEMDQILAGAFSEATGITINVVPKPASATENYAAYQRFFSAQSPDVDVMMIDVIWPGAFAPHLVDLSSALGQEAQAHYETIIENNTVDGKLVGMPWFGDFGMLYYRTDLLEKYGFSNPPETWDELEEMARTILEGERGANPNFAGFVFQGNAYEGLTCNALEWLASSGGGRFIENGQVTINNPQAVEILNKVRGWVGTIAPQGVTTYQEEDSRQVFQAGNAAFLRNWPYVYSLASGSDSPVRGKFNVAPLPAQPGNPHVGTVGGWQLAVSMYSRAPEAAIEFVRYMTSPEVQTWRAVLGSFVPTIPDVASRPEVLQAMPFLEPMEAVERVTRPSRETGERYNEVSTIIFQGVNQILTGQDAAQVLPGVAQRLQRIVG